MVDRKPQTSMWDAYNKSERPKPSITNPTNNLAEAKEAEAARERERTQITRLATSQADITNLLNSLPRALFQTETIAQIGPDLTILQDTREPHSRRVTLTGIVLPVRRGDNAPAAYDLRWVDADMSAASDPLDTKLLGVTTRSTILIPVVGIGAADKPSTVDGRLNFWDKDHTSYYVDGKGHTAKVHDGEVAEMNDWDKELVEKALEIVKNRLTVAVATRT